MARERDYKAEYRRRIERGRKLGKTRQQSRGHKAREHIERREREIEEHGITLSQMKTVFAWGERRNFEIKDHDIDGSAYVEAAQMNGYDWFKNYRHIWEAARRNYKMELRMGTYASRGEGFLADLTARAEADDVSWLYYH